MKTINYIGSYFDGTILTRLFLRGCFDGFILPGLFCGLAILSGLFCRVYFGPGYFDSASQTLGLPSNNIDYIEIAVAFSDVVPLEKWLIRSTLALSYYKALDALAVLYLELMSGDCNRKK